VKNIIDSTEKPLKFFKILENSTTLKKESFLDDKKTVEYVFERNNSIIKNISNYLSKNNINLVLVERDKNNKNLTESKIKDVIKNLDCSLILTP
jgi:predicted regulator of amino acid metabolism with ACT domain